MGAVNTTYTFTATDTITSTKMNDIIDQTTFTNDAVFDTTLAVASGKLKVNSQGITSNELSANAVTTDKIADLNVTTAKIAASSVTNDKLSTATGEIGAEWQSYTPIWTLTGTASNGNATIIGKYIKIGKTIHFYVTYTLGTTTSYSALTSMNVSLPLAASSSYKQQQSIGLVTFSNGINVAPGHICIALSSNVIIYAFALVNSVPVFSNVQTTPTIYPLSFSPNSNNYITVSGTYECA